MSMWLGPLLDFHASDFIVFSKRNLLWGLHHFSKLRLVFLPTLHPALIHRRLLFIIVCFFFKKKRGKKKSWFPKESKTDIDQWLSFFDLFSIQLNLWCFWERQGVKSIHVKGLFKKERKESAAILNSEHGLHYFDCLHKTIQAQHGCDRFDRFQHGNCWQKCTLSFPTCE